MIYVVMFIYTVYTVSMVTFVLIACNTTEQTSMADARLADIELETKLLKIEKLLKSIDARMKNIELQIEKTKCICEFKPGKGKKK